MNPPTQHTESSRKREPPTTEAEALSLISPALAAIVDEFRAHALSFNAWVHNGRPYVAVYGIKGGHLEDLQQRLLASGWGWYSPTCLVSWGTT
jgi:hypothetical protein